MGRQTNPIILRITAVTRTWDSKWFAGNRKDYRDNLKADLAIRKYFDTVLRMASISRIEIEKGQNEITLTVLTSRPALVIGRGGSGIEKIQNDLKPVIGKDVRLQINVQEVRNPDTDASAMATQVLEQLERRMPFRRVLKQSVGRAMQAGALGVKISLAGRLNGAEIARTEWLADGNVPLHTFRADISYSSKTAHTTYGTIGIKVWINRGELVVDEEKKEELKAKEQEKAKPRRRSLSEKAKASAKGKKK